MKIADIELGEKPLLLAPMEDVTDPSFRYMCKRFGADVPIIAMSVYSSGSEIESARNAGCNEFLVKPLSQYSLHRALNAALVEFKGKGKS